MLLNSGGSRDFFPGVAKGWHEVLGGGPFVHNLKCYGFHLMIFVLYTLHGVGLKSEM